MTFVLASKSDSKEIEDTLSKGLVIVESPAKAKTIQKYLGKGFSVEASLGHVKDLPKSTLGVDITNDFETDYVVIPGKEKVVAKLKKLAASADAIYLAPDPDREGEAIAAHLADELAPPFELFDLRLPGHRLLLRGVEQYKVKGLLIDDWP